MQNKKPAYRERGRLKLRETIQRYFTPKATKKQSKFKEA